MIKTPLMMMTLWWWRWWQRWKDDIFKVYDERQGQPPLFAVSHFIIWCKHCQFHKSLTILWFCAAENSTQRPRPFCLFSFWEKLRFYEIRQIFSDTKFPSDLVQVHISNTFQHYNVTKYSKIILKNAEHLYTINAQAETRHSDHNTTKLYWFHWLLTFDMCLFTFYIWHLLFAIWLTFVFSHFTFNIWNLI